MRVIVVEDDSLVALALRLALENLGYEVCAVTSTVEASLEAIERHRPDILTVDVQLENGGDGIVVAATAWTRWRIRSVFISGNVEGERRARSQDLPLIAYLYKPVDSRALAAALAVGRVAEERLHRT